MREDLKKILVAVLAQAHAEHIYIPDKEQYGLREHWVASLEGDCEDFALWCKETLETQWDIDTDLIFCRTEKGGGHLVASVDGWILDNRYKYVLSKDEMNYCWEKLGRDGVWYDISKDN